MTEPLQLVTLSGSLRQGSYNTALLRMLPSVAPAGMHFRMVSIAGVPVYDADLEARGMPDTVAELRDAIRASDGLIISTPEYNHSIPGGLKNALDWFSRPPAPHALYEVPVAVLGASDGMIGTTRAQAVLRQSLAALNAPTMPFPQVLVSHADQKIDADGALRHDATTEFIRAWLVEVDRWMRRFPRSERRAR